MGYPKGSHSGSHKVIKKASFLVILEVLMNILTDIM